MAKRQPLDANLYIEILLSQHLDEIAKHFKADGCALYGPIFSGVDDVVRHAIEQIDNKKEKLVFVLTTRGGYAETVQRIVATIRHHYKFVDFVIPNQAYSAGTILTLSGDAIHMDYYSRLGPIDAQVESSTGQPVPAAGYLKRYDQLISRARRGRLSTAEAQLLIDGFDQGDLYRFEKAKQYSISLLKDWLVRYKFKDWKKTRTRKRRVTRRMREKRAEEIAKTLSDTEKWHIHGYGISMEVLRKDLNLVIEDFGKNPELARKITSYQELMSDYMLKTRKGGAIQTCDLYLPYLTAS